MESRQQSPIEAMQTLKMFDSSSPDHNELDQNVLCTSRLSMPAQTTPSKVPLSRNNQIVVDNSNQRAFLSMTQSTKTTNSLESAIVKRKANDESTISSSMKSTIHNRMHNSHRHVRAKSNKWFQTRRAPFANSASVKTLLNYLIVTLALSSFLLFNHTSAFESGSSSEIIASQPAKQQQPHESETKAAASERSDSLSSASKSPESPVTASSSSSSQKSIVASLSSAVATAAAAAAVAAAQNGLSSNDARSLTSPGSHRLHAQNHAHRSPGLNLAIKLVDTIPEVPYNILHNMKKVDHAAPFYNAPNKFSGGAPKESTQNFLANALTATGAAEQLSVLFKSPLWKRIADGYGDFASEFRSLFRVPGATPMKGPSSSTSKILRDISVPAMLMLLASSISGEWRPVRTRRKSFRPVDIPASESLQTNLQVGGSLASLLNEPSSSSLTETADHPAAPQYFQRYEQGQLPQPQESHSNAQVSSYLPTPNNEWQQQQQQQMNPGLLNFGQQASQVGQKQTRFRDEASLRQLDSQSANWIAPDQVNIVGSGMLPFMANVGNDQQQMLDLQPAAATFGQQHAVSRRSGEISTDGQQPGGGETGGRLAYRPDPLAAALVSSSGQGSKLVTKLLNANVDNELSPSAKQQPLVLSAVAHAVTSMLSSRPVASGKSGSPASGSASAAVSLIGSPVSSAGMPNFLIKSNLLQNLMISDKTINDEHSQVLTRRQPQAEQRDLTKLLPESWRGAVKRTMSTVQQQANAQWKSIEGQLANWVQDKLKTVAASASSSPSLATSGSSSSAVSGSAVPAPIGNILASVSSTALNILGLHKNDNNSSSSSSSASSLLHTTNSAHASHAKSQSSGDEQSTSGTSTNQRGKIELTKAAQKQQQPSSKGAMAGVANLIVSTVSLRNSPSQSSSPKSTSLPQNNLQKSPPNDEKRKSQTLGEVGANIASLAISSIASKYPTLTGIDASSHSSSLVPTSPSASPSQVATNSTATTATS